MAGRGKRQAAGEMVPFGTQIPAALHRRLKVYCAEQEVSITEAVTRALEALLRGKKGRA